MVFDLHAQAREVPKPFPTQLPHGAFSRNKLVKTISHDFTISIRLLDSASNVDGNYMHYQNKSYTLTIYK